MSLPPISTIDARHGLRYRDHDVATLVGTVPYERVWGLLVDGGFDGGLPPAEPFPLPVRTGDHRVDLQSALAQLAPVWGFRPIIDLDPARVRSDLARASVMALSFLAQSARGDELPAVQQLEVNRAGGTAERFLMRWRGEVDDAAARAIDACWVAIAEHGLTASAQTARLIATTGADAAACLSGAAAAGSGPRAGGAAVRAMALLAETERTGDADAVVGASLDAGGLYGFGTGGYEVEDPRVRAMREVARSLRIPRLEAAEAVSRAGHAALADRGLAPPSDRGSHAMFWASVLLDFAGVSARMFTAMFVCGRVAGWSAHIADVHGELRLDLG